MGAAGAVYAVHHLAYGMIMQGGPPGRAETLSLMVMAAFVLSYTAFRFGDGLRKAKGSWSGRLLKAVATTVFAGLILVAVAYPYPVDSERSPEVDVILRSETTDEVWVVEAERKDDGWELDVKRDTMYLASATIIGLATFGSLVTVRILGDPITLKLRTQGFFMMYVGVIVVIICQSFLMYGACCGNISVIGFIGYFGVTVVALLSITIGAAQILALWLKDSSNKGE